MANKAHNQKTLDSLRPGDRVEFERTWYSHWGIYIGNDQIIHVGGDKGQKAEIKCENFWEAVKDGLATQNNSKDGVWSHLPPEEIVERAKGLMGKWDYNLVSENCEHLVNFCRYDVKVSEQVDNVMQFLLLAGLVTCVIIGGVAVYKSCKKERK